MLQEAEQEAHQISLFAASKIKQADQHSHPAVCALQVLVVTQHMCSPEELADILPSLLRMQSNKQVIAALALCYCNSLSRCASFSSLFMICRQRAAC